MSIKKKDEKTEKLSLNILKHFVSKNYIIKTISTMNKYLKIKDSSLLFIPELHSYRDVVSQKRPKFFLWGGGHTMYIQIMHNCNKHKTNLNINNHS